MQRELKANLGSLVKPYLKIKKKNEVNYVKIMV